MGEWKVVQQCGATGPAPAELQWQLLFSGSEEEARRVFRSTLDVRFLGELRLVDGAGKMRALHRTW